MEGELAGFHRKYAELEEKYNKCREWMMVYGHPDNCLIHIKQGTGAYNFKCDCGLEELLNQKEKE